MVMFGSGGAASGHDAVQANTNDLVSTFPDESPADTLGRPGVCRWSLRLAEARSKALAWADKIGYFPR